MSRNIIESLIKLFNEITKDKKIKKPWDKDPNYEVVGIESYREGPNLHLLDDVETHFIDNKIEIVYKESPVLACIILAFRCTDPLFKWDFIQVGNKIFESENFDDEKFLKENFDLISKNNKITIKARTYEDWDYEKSVIIFKTTSDYEDDYFLIKELERWDKIK